MLDGNTENRPPSVAEIYAGAVGDGVSRVAPHKTGRTDLIGAAGMSPHRTGTALMRLTSEWQGGATPPHAKPTTSKELRKAGVEADLADAEARLSAARCVKWHLHENKLRFQRLKTLPAVRTALLHWVAEREWENAEQLVADTLRHFLAPVCPVCQGRKRRVIQSRAIGSECKICRGTGEADTQHGGRGRVLLAYMKQCTGQAAADMREGAYRLHRPEKSEEDRLQRKENDKAQKLQRADAEAKVDAAQDTQAVAAGFAASLGKKRHT